VLYRVDQQNRLANQIPVLILNSLSDEKPAYFESYIADLDVTEETNKERKNIEEKKALAIPISFKSCEHMLTPKTFLVKSDWNFQETQNYNILFWPTEFDFLKAIIYKMLNRTYSPKISNDIYIASKVT
jgi:hypothetical protein